MSTSFDHEDALTPEQQLQVDALEAALAGPLAGSLPQFSTDSRAEAGEDVTELVTRLRGAYGSVDEDADAAVKSAGRSAGRPAVASDAFQARRVAQRVLSRTTREDLGRRGDVGVVLGFVSDRLRDSAVLRVAVALLIVQLTLVPLVAWQVWKAPHSGVFQARLEPSAEEIARALQDLPADDISHDIGNEPAGSRPDLELGQLALEDDLVETLACLLAMSAALGDVAPTSSVGHWLQVMTELAVASEGAGSQVDPLADRLASLESPTTPLAVLLAAEARLNFLAAGGGWVELPEALDAVAGSNGETVELASLRARTMRRAELLGVALPDEGEALIAEIAEGWERGSEAWLSALGAAATAAAPEDPYVTAWVAAIVQDS